MSHVSQSVKIRKEFIELLIDTGSAVNLIKFSVLTGDTPVHENRKIYLKGINDKVVSTVGQIKITLRFNEVNIETVFQVVRDSFPIPKDGILGQQFLRENKAIIDVANNSLIINNKIVNKIFNSVGLKRYLV